MHETGQAGVAFRRLDVLEARQTSGRSCGGSRKDWIKLELTTETLQFVDDAHVVARAGVDEREKTFQNFSGNSGKNDDYFVICDIAALVAVDGQERGKEATGWDLEDLRYFWRNSNINTLETEDVKIKRIADVV